jgi:hypothetical protein
MENAVWFTAITASLLCQLREAWYETELLHYRKRVGHDCVLDDFAVTDGVDVDRHPYRPSIAS